MPFQESMMVLYSFLQTILCPGMKDSREYFVLVYRIHTLLDFLLSHELPLLVNLTCFLISLTFYHRTAWDLNLNFFSSLFSVITLVLSSSLRVVNTIYWLTNSRINSFPGLQNHMSNCLHRCLQASKC